MKPVSKRKIFWSLFVTFIIYSIVIYTNGTEYKKGEELMTHEARVGKLVFQEYNCISCHQIYGLGGYMGPDLTTVISTKGKGELYARAFMKSGTAKMPNFHLNKDEINDLIAYLKYISKAGIDPGENLRSTWYGTVVKMEND